MKSLIVTTETNLDFSYYNNDNFYIVGVERGCLDLISKQIKIDLAISDFDHVTIEELSLIKQSSKRFIQLEQQKDLLDGEMAIIEANKFNAKEIIYVSKPTKRLDMNLTIPYLVNKYNIKMINDSTVVFKIPKGQNLIEFNKYQDITYISFFALKSNTELSISNAKYNIENLVLSPYQPLAISNAFLPYEDISIINNKDLLCILSK